MWIGTGLVLLAGACGDDPPPDDPVVLGCDASVAVETLRWKRADPLVTDLARALELEPETLCTELGTLSCSQLYRLPLGASDPFGAAIYKAPEAPMNTTSALVERVTLAACARRVSLDRSGTAVVFRHVDLEAKSLTPTSPGVDAQVDELYRRLLSRVPTDEERATVAALADGLSGADFAALSCFSIGTTTEFLFF